MSFRILIFAPLLLALNSCGASPLLNHSDAKDTPAALRVNSVCPLTFSQSKLCAKIDWIVGPDGAQENSFRLSFCSSETGDAKGPFVDPRHSVTVQLWMPSMGHGSSPVAVAAESAGIFRVTRVFFIMPGDWEIRVKLQKGAEVIEQAAVSLVIP